MILHINKKMGDSKFIWETKKIWATWTISWGQMASPHPSRGKKLLLSLLSHRDIFAIRNKISIGILTMCSVEYVFIYSSVELIFCLYFLSDSRLWIQSRSQSFVHFDQRSENESHDELDVLLWTLYAG